LLGVDKPKLVVFLYVISCVNDGGIKEYTLRPHYLTRVAMDSDLTTGGSGTDEMQDNYNVKINIEIISKNICRCLR
jgi:hypothetical protein